MNNKSTEHLFEDSKAVIKRVARLVKLITLLVCGAFTVMYFSDRGHADQKDDRAGQNKEKGFDATISANAEQMLVQGRQIFRFDTFGDELFWTDTLKLHKAIEGSKFGGVGSGVNPKTALAVGLKVDMDALPEALVNQVKEGKVNLDDPATTLALLKLNAVIGVVGRFNQDGSLKSMGLSCAVCHSTVDDAFMPGIGHRLDGWPKAMGQSAKDAKKNAHELLEKVFVAKEESQDKNWRP
jgi:hypothetical protein